MLLFPLKSLVLALAFACTSVFATPIPLAPLLVNVAGAQSYDLRGTPGNTVWNFNVGANTMITSIAWNFTLTAYAPSFLSEIELAFTDSSGSGGVIFQPADIDLFSGTNAYVGTFDLAANALAFNVLNDGILRLEFLETVKDMPTGVADGQWNAGSMTFGLTQSVPQSVPEPASALLMGVGLQLLSMRLRRRRPA